jgi:hypothetical protein
MQNLDHAEPLGLDAISYWLDIHSAYEPIRANQVT